MKPASGLWLSSEFFLLHAEAANASIVDVTGFDHTDLEYKQHYTQVRAMSQGTDSRGVVRP